MFEFVYPQVAAKLTQQVGFVRRHAVGLVPRHSEHEVVRLEVAVAGRALVAASELLEVELVNLSSSR